MRSVLREVMWMRDWDIHEYGGLWGRATRNDAGSRSLLNVVEVLKTAYVSEGTQIYYGYWSPEHLRRVARLVRHQPHLISYSLVQGEDEKIPAGDVVYYARQMEEY